VDYIMQVNRCAQATGQGILKQSSVPAFTCINVSIGNRSSRYWTGGVYPGIQSTYHVITTFKCIHILTC